MIEVNQRENGHSKRQCKICGIFTLTLTMNAPLNAEAHFTNEPE